MAFLTDSNPITFPSYDDLRNQYNTAEIYHGYSFMIGVDVPNLPNVMWFAVMDQFDHEYVHVMNTLTPGHDSTLLEYA